MTIIEQILSDYFIYKCACYSYDNSRDNSPHVAVCSSRLTAWTWIYNSFKARGQLAPILAVSRAFHFPFSASCTDLPQNHTQFPPRFEQKKNRTSPNATEHVLIKLIFFPHSLSLCFNHIFSNLAFHTAAAAVAHLAAHGPRHSVPTPACRPAHMRILITLSVDFDVCKWIELNWDWLHQ